MKGKEDHKETTRCGGGEQLEYRQTTMVFLESPDKAVFSELCSAETFIPDSTPSENGVPSKKRETYKTRHDHRGRAGARQLGAAVGTEEALAAPRTSAVFKWMEEEIQHLETTFWALFDGLFVFLFL